MPYVFQYGSNMSAGRLQHPSRIPEAIAVGSAWTESSFEVSFAVRSIKGYAVSGLVPGSPGRKIFGVLFQIERGLIFRDECRVGRKTLDQIEGGGNSYHRVIIPVLSSTNNGVVEAITYLPASHSWEAPTTKEYASHIRDGLAEWNAPPEYRNYIEHILKRALESPANG